MDMIDKEIANMAVLVEESALMGEIKEFLQGLGYSTSVLVVEGKGASFYFGWTGGDSYVDTDPMRLGAMLGSRARSKTFVGDGISPARHGHCVYEEGDLSFRFPLPGPESDSIADGFLYGHIEKEAERKIYSARVLMD